METLKTIEFVSAQKAKVKVIRARVEEVIGFINLNTHLAMDFETTGRHPALSKPLLLSVGTSKKAYVIDCRTTSREDIVRILTALAEKKVFMHNGKFDQKMALWHYGVAPHDLIDTMLASQLLNAGFRISNALDAVLERVMDVELNKDTRQSFINMPDIKPFTEEQILYSGMDVLHLPDLARILYNKLASMGMVFLFELECRLSYVLSHIELKGIDMDISKWRKLSRHAKSRVRWCELLMDRELKALSRAYIGILGGKYTRKRQHHEVHVPDMFDPEFDTVIESENPGNINYKSPGQIKELFQRLGIPLLNENDEESAKEAVLRTLLHENAYPDLNKFLGFLLMHREYSKLLSTYGDSFLDFINPFTGRIHTSFRQCQTTTGRLSSGDDRDDKGKALKYYVNFQNIPKIKDYRSCFTVPSDDYRYITYDLSGAELCILASNSQDPTLLKAQNDKKVDLHSILATETYRIITGDPDFVVSQQHNSHLRQRHKSVIFGVAYGAGPSRVAEILDIDETTAGRVLQGIYRKLPLMKQHLDEVQSRALRNYKVISNTRTNRVRNFTTDMVKQQSWKVKREAANMPIQGTNADMIKEALVELFWKLEKYDAWIVNTVHDEISVVAHKDIATEVEQIVQDTMVDCANRYLNGVTMAVDGKIDKHWVK